MIGVIRRNQEYFSYKQTLALQWKDTVDYKVMNKLLRHCQLIGVECIESGRLTGGATSLPSRMLSIVWSTDRVTWRSSMITLSGMCWNTFCTWRACKLENMWRYYMFWDNMLTAIHLWAMLAGNRLMGNVLMGNTFKDKVLKNSVFMVLFCTENELMFPIKFFSTFLFTDYTFMDNFVQKLFLHWKSVDAKNDYWRSPTAHSLHPWMVPVHERK